MGSRRERQKRMGGRLRESIRYHLFDGEWEKEKNDASGEWKWFLAQRLRRYDRGIETWTRSRRTAFAAITAARPGNGVNIYWITHEKPEVSKIIRIKFYANDAEHKWHTAQNVPIELSIRQENGAHHLCAHRVPPRSSHWINYSHSHNIHKYISFMK